MLRAECCLGTMTWGCQNTEAEAHEQLSYAWDMGVNFLDTAGKRALRTPGLRASMSGK